MGAAASTTPLTTTFQIGFAIGPMGAHDTALRQIPSHKPVVER